ncbi:ParB/RepB/Spo0J family partition protein [Selenomonas timonae]|uniref:ParB/RepB/Spo0J family partition protein n=1 Tax=Selenomonas timonae TaxID=2754044 RepID=A0A7G7VLF2_9FIRM|nr:ParB/RepB/Spo0J family partition protein [Selenomonas timonae]QNH54945.1 ParB/RepB/Spo0J family partition protein [Selenomonas timonae]
MKKAKTGGLGRGLGALGLGKNALAGASKPAEQPAPPETEAPAAQTGKPAELPVDAIVPNRFQPRREFDEAALEELRESIVRHGILQPLSVRDIGGGKYELIAGERRLRAARLAGLATVPVVFRTASDAELAEMALIENIQREDLNPIEEARAYERLLTEFRLSQEELARRVARSRSAIANSVRLLRLADEVQAFVANGVLTMGQVRPLLTLGSAALQREAAEYIQEHELSARGAEALVKRLIKDPNALKKTAQPVTKRTPDIFVREAEERLTRSLGTKVRIQEGREQGKGRLEISYFSADDLERLLGLLTGADGAAKEDKRAALRAISTQKFTV